MLKRTIFLSFAFIALLLTSCKEDCDAPPVEENIVGEWTVQTGGEVEFKADGTLIDPDDSIIGNGNPDSDKTWNIAGNKLDVKVTEAGSFLSTSLNIVENECDKITIGFLGINLDMERK